MWPDHRLVDLLGIEHPLVLAPMAGLGTVELAAAVCAGGGNFGVVTAMRYRLHSLPCVRTGLLVYPFSEARAVLERCAEIAASSPEDLTVEVGCVGGPDGKPVVLVHPTWCGLPAESEARVAPFLKVRTLARRQPRSHVLWNFADLVRPVYRQWAASVHGHVLAARGRQRRHRCFSRSDVDRRLGPPRRLYA
jgi:FAD/FMN-containing dehydrogenase